ncbi:DUF6678 family protein [Bradyrhizobium sp. A5]|uniref:DUF6678 family protein n=1 Tax=Bradyrhizobium sp. A5 TaxID=3133696 RepID=UPI0035C85028
MIQRSEYFSVANDTKWRELRAAMLGLDGADQPDFRCKDLEGGSSVAGMGNGITTGRTVVGNRWSGPNCP